MLVSFIVLLSIWLDAEFLTGGIAAKMLAIRSMPQICFCACFEDKGRQETQRNKKHNKHTH